MTDLAGHEASLGGLLTASGWTGAEVTVTGAASVGANRATLFIDIDDGADTVEAVAQISRQTDSSASREAEILQLAAAAGVPVPRVLAMGDRLGDDEHPVLITTRLEGLSIPRRILRSLPNDAAGDALAVECGDALARLHSIPADAIPESVDRLDPADPHGDYCDFLDDMLDEQPTRHPAIRLGINWLRRNRPSVSPRPSLVHADFRNGNMLVHEGRLVAMLDWELAHVGDPMEDLAWMCVRMWRFGYDDRPCGGFGSIDALRSGYEAAGGTWRDDAFRWWLTARTAWWATGLARQGAAFMSGESDSIVHAASGRRVPELEYDLLTLITQNQEN